MAFEQLWNGWRSEYVRAVPNKPVEGGDGRSVFTAILESGEEWATHRKLHEMKAGSVRGTVPPGFSYFGVSFGIQSGYATVIENTDEWPADFGRDVLDFGE